MPRSLAVVIPSHCRADLLRECLASVLEFAPPQTDILVVDDASCNGVISSTAAAMPGVRVLRLTNQGGFCRAVNAGIRATSAEFVEILNDDTLVTAGWADAALSAFSDPQLGAVAPLVLKHNIRSEETIVDSAGDRYYIGGIAGKRDHGQRLTDTHLKSRRVFGASASSAFFRRAALETAGLFPESFGAYFDDIDLSFRLHWAGYQVQFESGSRVYHRVSSSYGKPKDELLEQQSRNEELVFWRNLPCRLLLRSLPAHGAVVAAKAFRRWREGQLRPFLRGRLQALIQLPEVMQHRRRLCESNPPANPAPWNLDTSYWQNAKSA